MSCLEDCFSADCVESVGEVELHQHLATGVGVPLHPATDAVDDHLGSKGHANPDLGWPEKGARFSTNLLEQTLSGEAAINFANGDGSHSSVGLRHGDQTCSGKGRGGSGTSLPLREQVDHGRELLKEAVHLLQAWRPAGAELGGLWVQARCLAGSCAELSQQSLAQVRALGATQA